MVPGSNSRRWALVGVIALAAFFAFATHWHADSQQELNCAVCQAGGLHVVAPPPAAALEAPQVADRIATPDTAQEEYCAHLNHPSPRGPPQAL